MSLLAIEFHLNSKSAYTAKCIHKCIHMYECTSVVIRDLKLFEKKKTKKTQQDLYKSLQDVH